MIIREYLDRREHPYKRDKIICLAIFITSAIAILVLIRTNSSDIYEGDLGWHFWALLAFGILYLLGFIGLATAEIMRIIRIRCPKCNKRIRTRTKHWRYCPLCGVDFESEVS